MSECVTFHFRYPDTQSVQHMISQTSCVGKSKKRQLSKALDFASMVLFSEGGAMRSSVPKILLVVAQGKTAKVSKSILKELKVRN